MSKDIIVEFSGWVRLDAKSARFVRIDGSTTVPIDGIDWQNMSENDRDNYILEDVIAAQRDCVSNDYDMVNVFTD